MAGRALRLLAPLATVSPVAVDKLPDDVAPYSAVALVTQRPCPEVAASLHERCWTARVPWCEATLLAHEFRVGPAVLAGTTPCYECFRRRVRSQTKDVVAHDLLEYLARHTTGSWFQGELPALNEQVAALLAAEVVALATNAYVWPGRHLGRFWEGDAVYGELRAHVFARVGRCNRCGAAARGDQTDRLAAFFEKRVVRWPA